jgi:hypothetical protein
MYWLTHRPLVSTQEAKDSDRQRSMIEMPPPGYAGSLAGTVWDDGAVVAAYRGA